AAKAAIGTLRDPELEVPEADREELLEAADQSLDRLTRLVENLLDMSRLQAGAIKLRLEAIAADEIVPRAVDDVTDVVEGRVTLEPPQSDVPAVLGPVRGSDHGESADRLRLAARLNHPSTTRYEDAPGARPCSSLSRFADHDPNPEQALADGPLLERALANLVANAVKHTDSPVTVTVSALGGHVEVRVIDRGPGIAVADRGQVFLPFQRLGDRDNAAGVGLGLALARGLVEAMGGTLTPEDTPGGGLTMVLALPAAVSVL
ncbi:sensor histidine kinase, partial [Actinocrinis sp.]|uniref:sensor histidine kinase n=1 Tax=Actinocrinis sp. TaxID=1920516 RepID=UPI002C36F7D1